MTTHPPPNASAGSVPALTLWRPWTSCITDIPVPAAKRIENRRWVTRHRGDVYLHAGQRFDDGAVALANQICARTIGATEPVLTDDPDSYPTGIVAVADLVDICTVRFDTFGKSCHCGPWAFPGQAHWRFDNIRVLARPVPCRGAQRLWTPPVDVDTSVRAQLAATTV